MNIEKSLQEIMKTAQKHANPKDPAFDDWQFIHAITYDLLSALDEE